MNEYLSSLLAMQDENYKIFTKKLVPDTKYEVLGIRVPLLKNLAKQIVKNNKQLDFFQQKHFYYEEYFLHGLIIGISKFNIDKTISFINDFISNIDNWAICDSTVSCVKIFTKYPQRTLLEVKKWLKADNPYTIRFAIVTLLDYFLDENFSTEIFDLICNIKSENYYINMALAWFYSVALVKQYDSAIKIIESKTLSPFVQNKTIQKSHESYRITQDKKEYLKSFKI